MKNNFLLILFLSLFYINSQAQSEKETIDFLNSKLALYTSSLGTDPTYFKVKTGEDHGKVILIDLYTNNSLLSTMKFHCNQIDGITTFRPGNGKLCLKIISSKGLILNKYASESNETFSNSETIPLEAPDDEALRIKKAFEHLFQMNGTNLGNDSLFKN